MRQVTRSSVLAGWLGALVFAVCALLSSASWAQPLPAPAGTGWVWHTSSASSGWEIVLPAPASGTAWELFIVSPVSEECGSGFMGWSSIAAADYMVTIDGNCVASWDPWQVVPRTELAGIWVRSVYLSPDPPSSAPSAASSAAATEGTLSSLSSAVAAVFWLMCTALGFHGYSVGSRDV